MKKVYLFLFIGVVAIAAIVISLMNFNPSVETWSSLLAGGAIGFLIVKTPAIIDMVKKRKQKSAK